MSSFTGEKGEGRDTGGKSPKVELTLQQQIMLAENEKNHGQRGDPRMNRAVSEKLLDPNMSLFQALTAGGFQFPCDEENSIGFGPVYDKDNILLSQRKNQLCRRLRSLTRKSENIVKLKKSRSTGKTPEDESDLGGGESISGSTSTHHDDVHQQEQPNIKATCTLSKATSPTLIIEKLESIITDMECPICLTMIEDTHVVPECGHRFCGSCIKKSLRTCNNECPSCRIPIATKRTLRQDELFDNLIQKLSCIIQQCSDDSDDFNFETFLDSLKALLWHFQCPLCSNELDDTRISTECLHRVCKDCIVRHHISSASRNTSASTIGRRGVARSVTLIDAQGEVQLNNVQCPCCQSNTRFVIDKHFENINKAIHGLIEMLEGDYHGDYSAENETYDDDSATESFHDTTMNAIIPDYMPSSIQSSSITANNGTAHLYSHTSFTNAVPDEVLSNLPQPSTFSGLLYENDNQKASGGSHLINEKRSSIGFSSTNTPSRIESHGSIKSSSCIPLITTSRQVTDYDDDDINCDSRDNNIHTNDKATTGKTEQNHSSTTVPSLSKLPSFKPASKVTVIINGTKLGVKPKFAIGSRFFNLDSEKIGRIVGFDGDFYKIVFPQDKSCDLWKEENFKSVKFIHQFKRPTQPKKVQRRQQNKKRDMVLCCPNCNERFSSNAKDEVSGKAPVQSQNCPHVLCINCIQSIRMNSLPKKARTDMISSKKLRVTVDCPLCKKSQSFNAEKPNICQAMCQMVRLYDDMEYQRKEDRIRKIIEKEEHEKNIKKEREKKDRKKRCHSSSMDEHDKKQSAVSSKKIKQVEQGKGHKPLSSISSSSNKKKKDLIKCKSCTREKVAEKYSSKQMEKYFKQKAKPLCRRCEEKNIVKHKLGSGAEKVCTTVLVAKKHGSKPKFLTTIVPWSRGHAQKESTPLPPDLTIDGYTRDSWGMMANKDAKEEECWIKATFWSSGGGVTEFLKFLQEHKKSAYGTFVLPDRTDGFFVIPFDQPSKTSNSPESIFHCKYIFGLGLVGDNQNKDIEVSKQGSNNISLRNLIAAEFRSSQALSVVPKGSVQAARKLASRPEQGPSINAGVANWDRARIVIRESDIDSDDNDSNGSDGMHLPEDMKLETNCDSNINLRSSTEKYDL